MKRKIASVIVVNFICILLDIWSIYRLSVGSDLGFIKYIYMGILFVSIPVLFFINVMTFGQGGNGSLIDPEELEKEFGEEAEIETEAEK